jgi:hypothetical protein
MEPRPSNRTSEIVSFDISHGGEKTTTSINAVRSSSSSSAKPLHNAYDVMIRTLENYWVQVGLQTVMFVLFFLVGCIYYHHVEGWSFGECLTFSVVTISTVGMYTIFSFAEFNYCATLLHRIWISISNY